MKHTDKDIKRILFSIGMAGSACLAFASCNGANGTNETGSVVNSFATIDSEEIDWRNDPNIGKVPPGYYKRIGIVKDGETYEEMLELREMEGRGYLIIKDDGTAVFDLDGEKTEYAYDEYNLYLSGEAEGIPYVYIGGRLLVDDGTTITQYFMLSEEELASYLGNGEPSASCGATAAFD